MRIRVHNPTLTIQRLTIGNSVKILMPKHSIIMEISNSAKDFQALLDANPLLNITKLGTTKIKGVK